MSKERMAEELYNMLDMMLTAADMVDGSSKDRLSVNLVYLREVAADARRTLRRAREMDETDPYTANERRLRDALFMARCTLLQVGAKDTICNQAIGYIDSAINRSSKPQGGGSC